MAGQLSELDRLQLQARTWEPAGRRLLERLGSGAGMRVIDVGCGCLGWLRLLSEWVGPAGEVLGTDIDDPLLEAAAGFVASEGLGNVRLLRDDLFASDLPDSGFDLVHARFQIAPLGRGEDQIAAFRRLAARGGHIVVEEPDSSSWRYNPGAPCLERLISLILDAFRDAGGDFDAGRSLPTRLGSAGLDPSMRAEVLALPHGHAYLGLPLQFSRSLESRLSSAVSDAELRRLRDGADAELAEAGRWGTTFTLIQAWATVL